MDASNLVNGHFVNLIPDRSQLAVISTGTLLGRISVSEAVVYVTAAVVYVTAAVVADLWKANGKCLTRV